MKSNGNHSANGVVIEKGIPMPNTSGRNRKYPWTEMQVGDSFAFPSNRKRAGAYAGARVASQRYAPRQFAARQHGEGVRCWRIA